ncbi:MAG: hypothetical protein PVF68_13225, partial [Acidobacteriota bacterium]
MSHGTSIRRRPVLLAGFLLLVASPLCGAYRVDEGETFEAIARAEFANPSLAHLIALHNGLPPDRLPPAGTKLHFPKAKVIHLMIPQRYETLAFRLLGDEALAPLLAAVNGEATTDPVQFREGVVVPAMVEYRRRDDESFEEVARRAYGAGGPSWPIALANPNPRKTLLVPVIGFFRESLGDQERRLVRDAENRLRAPSPPRTGASSTPGPAGTLAEGRPGADGGAAKRSDAGGATAAVTVAPGSPGSGRTDADGAPTRPAHEGRPAPGPEDTGPAGASGKAGSASSPERDDAGSSAPSRSGGAAEGGGARSSGGATAPASSGTSAPDGGAERSGAPSGNGSGPGGPGNPAFDGARQGSHPGASGGAGAMDAGRPAPGSAGDGA